MFVIFLHGKEPFGAAESACSFHVYTQDDAGCKQREVRINPKAGACLFVPGFVGFIRIKDLCYLCN